MQLRSPRTHRRQIGFKRSHLTYAADLWDPVLDLQKKKEKKKEMRTRRSRHVVHAVGCRRRLASSPSAGLRAMVSVIT
jgi:hypothetical protein